jgi:hypothetical protein
MVISNAQSPSQVGENSLCMREREGESMSLKVAWNRNETASVVIAKVKEFTITPNIHDQKYSVRGWYNKENYFSFGDDFETLPIAQSFLTRIHGKI